MFEPIHKSKFSSIGRGVVAGTILNGLNFEIQAHHALMKQKKIGDYDILEVS
jgi:hypothetical protein